MSSERSGFVRSVLTVVIAGGALGAAEGFLDLTLPGFREYSSSHVFVMGFIRGAIICTAVQMAMRGMLKK